MNRRGYAFLELVLGSISLTLAGRAVVLGEGYRRGKQESEQES
jgi:hypothetical protein